MGFIYVHPFAKYLSIDNPASHLTLPFNNKLDLHSLDLKKPYNCFENRILRLLSKRLSKPINIINQSEWSK
ncbi:hypothetical protein BGI15_09240 [Snodgrassella alvi]|uniref:hypothetical protein n=1 Tax=Snodgrassella alvi TaxID=1196083 RepID=UPI000A0541F2|nr:hypothetical protein BGI07_10395 [Snodgrassella alvi]ORF30572.1 hypothetical protein BGI10_07710 [Snodgrassella alvi]ORF33885.1 hypothetical protein BGI11_07105 [Snodgrassella alvi]ORF36909.1 hypothetical protein BGI13_10660 [Snodgrassella alvi]ORF39763.1 hypothetical protein BGI14_06460 [Snodgrassella alvi]